MTESALNSFFTAALMDWHAQSNNRSLPWKNEKDPYKIWLSEVILQQTRALQGLDYYLSFTNAYPAISDLATANDDDVFRLWQGLGYYNRCKNMLATARRITYELGGRFPSTFEEIMTLKGVGPYTAAAIASFAFGLPHAVTDGNVYRVLARFFGISTPYDTTEGKAEFAALAGKLLFRDDSAAYNQAVMDFGATVCTPRNPLCSDCPLRPKCAAYRDDLIDVLPVKSKKVTVKERFFHYLLLEHEGAVWITKRTGKDIWANLHEPLLIEAGAPLAAADLQNDSRLAEVLPLAGEIIAAGDGRQRLTHQIISARFYRVPMQAKCNLTGVEGKWMTRSELKKTAFPKTLVSFLENNLYF